MLHFLCPSTNGLILITISVNSVVDKFVGEGRQKGLVSPDKELATNTATTKLILKFLDIKNSASTSSSDVAGSLSTNAGPSVIRNASLPSSVAKAKLDKATLEVSLKSVYMFLEPSQDAAGQYAT